MDGVASFVLPLISAALSAALLAVFKKLAGDFGDRLNNLRDITEANNAATFVLLQDRLAEACKYWQARGTLPAHDAEQMQRLFEQYTKMGGNGYIRKQVEITLELPQE